MYDGFVEAYAKTTGEKHRIPRHYLGDPVLGADFELTPTGREQQRQADGPSLDWSLAQLREYADAHGVDRAGLQSKADTLAAIEAQQAAQQTPGTAEGQDGDPDGTPHDPTPTSDGQTVTETQE